LHPKAAIWLAAARNVVANPVGNRRSIRIDVFSPAVVGDIFDISGDRYDKVVSNSDQGYRIGFFAGTFSTIAIGIPVGILMGKNHLIDELWLPWVNMFLSTLLNALVPVLIVLFTIAFTIAEFLAHLERKVGYYSARC